MAYRKIPKVVGFTRKEVIAFFKIKLKTDLKWAYEALERLYSKQTNKETKQLFSQGRNNVGFNKIDSLLMMTIFKNIKKRNFITKDEEKIIKDKMEKYAIQMASMSDPVKIKIAMDKYFKGLK